MKDPKYPIGKYEYPEHVTAEDRQRWLDDIRTAPKLFRDAAQGMTDAQLDTPYREGGWTVRQVIHHMADSHMNSYVRFRLALTEDAPMITGYKEGAWAELRDGKFAPVELSLSLLEALHARWVMLLETLTPEDLQRTFRHPERGLMTLERNLAVYAWHGRHHLAHVEMVKNTVTNPS